MGYNNRENFWFGTEERPMWFRTPMRNAEMNPVAWSEGGTYLNGGGYQFNSWGSHKTYTFEWGSASAAMWAQKMKAYFDGTYGRGPIYFLDPTEYKRNILPAQWADPSIALGSEGTNLVYGVTPQPAITPANNNDYPIRGATYDMTFVEPGWRGREDALFIPIPEGYTLHLGVAYTSTGGAGVYARTSTNGDLGVTVVVPPISITGTERVNLAIDGGTSSGVWIYLGTSGGGSITLLGSVARLFKTLDFPEFQGYGLEPYGLYPYGSQHSGLPVELHGPWSPGTGNSGCRFQGSPTYDLTGPLDGGQVGFSASFREVGSWLY